MAVLVSTTLWAKKKRFEVTKNLGCELKKTARGYQSTDGCDKNV